jgi:hypothetical protein
LHERDQREPVSSCGGDGKPLQACTIRVGLSVPACYPNQVRFALRGCAVLALVLGIAVVAPVERVDTGDAGITPAGERGETPAIRTGADLGRRLAHHAPVALPAPAATLRGPHLAAVVRLPRPALPCGRLRAGAWRARAPPPPA